MNNDSNYLEANIRGNPVYDRLHSMIDSHIIITEEDRLYWYRCELDRVIDGDTVVLHLDLGCNTWIRSQPCRLYNINTPEMRGVERVGGIDARNHMIKLLDSAGGDLMCKTHKDKQGKYGRWLVELYHHGNNLNEQMITDGYALSMDGRYG